MKFLCDSCEKYPCDDSAIKLMKYCPVYSPKPKPQTNADRIRKKSDEELAEWLEGLVKIAAATGRDAFDKTWVEWLKEEVN